MRASFKVSHLIAAEGKPFTEGEFVKRCILAVVEELMPEKKKLCEEISLSRRTVTRRIEELGDDACGQLKSRVNNFTFFSLAMDESTDITDTAQLLIFVRGIDDDFNITEELASLQSIHDQTTGENILKHMESCIESLGLQWEHFIGLTTDGAGRLEWLVLTLEW